MPVGLPYNNWNPRPVKNGQPPQCMGQCNLNVGARKVGAAMKRLPQLYYGDNVKEQILQKWDPVSKRVVNIHTNTIKVYVEPPPPPKEVNTWYINTLIPAAGVHVKYLNNNLYYTTSANVLSVRNLTTGGVTTLAGNGTSGTPADGSVPSTSVLTGITSFHVDNNNNIYISTEDRVLYMIPAVAGNYFGKGYVMLANRIYSIGGNAISGSTISGSAALSTSFVRIENIDTDYQGNLFLAISPGAGDSNYTQCVAMMPRDNGAFFGLNMTVGNIYIVAGNTNFTDNGYNQLATTANLNKPEGVLLDNLGNLIICDSFRGRIGMVPRVAGTYFNVNMPTVGNIYLIAGNGLNNGNTGDGGAAILATLRVPSRMVLDTEGNLYFSDRYNHRIRKITSSGIISNVAGNSPSGLFLGGFGGDGGLASNSKLNRPAGLAISDNNTIYVLDEANGKIRILTYLLP